MHGLSLGRTVHCMRRAAPACLSAASDALLTSIPATASTFAVSAFCLRFCLSLRPPRRPPRLPAPGVHYSSRVFISVRGSALRSVPCIYFADTNHEMSACLASRGSVPAGWREPAAPAAAAACARVHGAAWRGRRGAVSPKHPQPHTFGNSRHPHSPHRTLPAAKQPGSASFRDSSPHARIGLADMSGRGRVGRGGGGGRWAQRAALERRAGGRQRGADAATPARPAPALLVG